MTAVTLVSVDVDGETIVLRRGTLARVYPRSVELVVVGLDGRAREVASAVDIVDGADRARIIDGLRSLRASEATAAKLTTEAAARVERLRADERRAEDALDARSWFALVTFGTPACCSDLVGAGSSAARPADTGCAVRPGKRHL